MADEVPDPYGIDIALDAYGDVVVWPNGALGTVTGPDTCVQALRVRMLTLPGELTLHPEYGSTFPALVGRKLDVDVLATEASNEVRRVVQADSRFLAGQNVEAHSVDGMPTAARVALEVVLAGGERIIVEDLAEPGIDSPVEVDDVDLDDVDLDALSDGDEFIAQDEDEADDLRDAVLLDDLVEADEPFASPDDTFFNDGDD